MNKIRWILPLLVCCFFLFSCGNSPSYETQSFFAMDTVTELRIYSRCEDASSVFSEGKALVKQIEESISVTKQQSDTARFNETGTVENASAYFLEMLAISKEISEATDGAFDVRCGSVIELWETCEDEGRVPTEKECYEAATLTTGDILTEGSRVSSAQNGQRINFGAIGKGYAADKIARQMQASGVECGLISFVSSITVFGERPEGDFSVAIRCPDGTNRIAGRVSLQNESLSVSGNYERYYEIEGTRYDHILNPKTGKPSDWNIDSVVVVAETGALADALSTAITVMGPEKALALYEKGTLPFEAAIFSGEDLLVTDGFLSAFESEESGYELKLLSEQY